MVRLGMHGVYYQSYMLVPHDGNWEVYSVVQSPDWCNVEVWLDQYKVDI